MTTHYFSPGPATLPAAVRDLVKLELLDTFGIGVSVMEISHRSKHYEQLNDETLRLAHDVFEVPSTHRLLFTPFGAQQHFSLLLNHLSRPGDTVAYTETGVWAHLATVDAQASERNVVVVFDGGPKLNSLGNPKDWKIPEEAKYLHLTVNNTVEGTEYPTLEFPGKVPLVLDMTSALASRRDIPWQRTDLIYASAQKNFGIAGCSVVILKNDIFEQARATAKKNLLGNALNYCSIFDAKSILNTPPVFPIFVANRYLHWMKSVGGIETMEKWALERARMVYGEIDGEFYQGHAIEGHRSRHNFVFKLKTPELDSLFVAEAQKEGILEIKGYRTLGGVRASMYNGISLESAQYFAQFMRQFRSKHG
ncbi:3-phosphoserine/phosphohydroxythreonine transaminase [bacterium]|nr:3-phosphoserine/phosphohydroxythreonine transaminase [bacterium]